MAARGWGRLDVGSGCSVTDTAADLSAVPVTGEGFIEPVERCGSSRADVLVATHGIPNSRPNDGTKCSSKVFEFSHIVCSHVEFKAPFRFNSLVFVNPVSNCSTMRNPSA